MFSLTNEERRIVVFLLSTFLLGVGMKSCRENQRNQRPPSLPADSAPSQRTSATASPVPTEDAVPNPD
ncbi:MAG: hypothetical protein H7Y20_06635 [Bryobacteraceae bacterium]|nr:hypothetical protein [Bryobacteraceae bacterium]